MTIYMIVMTAEAHSNYEPEVRFFCQIYSVSRIVIPGRVGRVLRIDSFLAKK